MKWLSVILFSVFISPKANSQVVKFIKNEYQAKYRVYETKNPSEASHWIFAVQGPTDIRKPGDWYIVTNLQLFSNAMLLYKVKTKQDADMIVYYVSTKDSAQIRTKTIN